MVGNMAKDHSITEGSGQILTQGDLVVVQGYRREVRGVIDGGVMVIWRMHWVHSHRDNGIPRQKLYCNIECDEECDEECDG